MVLAAANYRLDMLREGQLAIENNQRQVQSVATGSDVPMLTV